MDRIKLKSLLVSPDISVKQAMHKLNETAEKILFVTDKDDMLLGTITDGDIRRGIINGKQLTETIKVIMSKKFFSINSGNPDFKKEARDIMQRHFIEHIPIITDNGLIIDVISWLDCLSSESDNQADVKNMLHNTVVIMAGGKGTRLDPFTKILPKPLIPMHNKPIVEHIMDRFYKNGFNNFILVLNYKKEMIKNYFSENSLPYDIGFVEEGDYYGTAGGLSLLKNKLNETFIVTNCDTILEGDYIDFFKWHKEMNNVMTIVGSHKEVTVPYGVLNMSNGSLVGIDEKPKMDMFINTGTYIFEPAVFDFINEKECLDMDKLVVRVSESLKEKLGVYPHWGGWFDIGQWDEYRMSLKHIGEQTDEL